jgi:seryl-tRNA synthetase
MLDPKRVAQDFDGVVARLKTRGGNLDLSSFQTLFAKRKEFYVALEALSLKRAQANDEMKARAKEGPTAISALRDSLRTISQEIKDQETQLKSVEEQLEQMLLHIPNLPDPAVPVGTSEADNVVVRTWGEKPTLNFTPKQHFEIGEQLGGLDFERAAKVSGSRFAYLRGSLARLERALVSFMIDFHTSNGYTELLPPYLVTRASMTITGQLPKFEDEAFKTMGEHELFLIPTSEVPITNYHADEILDGATLPLRYCAFSPCFRAEAGAAGKDTRGLIRMHQFHKVEMVNFTTPEQSAQALAQMVDAASGVLQKLGLHHRIVQLCTADMGFTAAQTFDLEVWLPGQNAYREISSCSNCGDFQARRGKIRFRPAAGEKPQLAHTLNGSGLAVGRTLVALLENGQRDDGSVQLPEALWPYLGGLKELRAS